MAVSSASTGKPTTETARSEQGSLTDWIQNEIRRTIKQIRLLEITVAMAQCWVSLIVVSTVAIMLDHWVMPLPMVARFIFWFALLGISGWSLLRRVLPLLIYRINPLYAAQMVENSLPELKNSLVSWWQLKHEDAGASRGVVAAVGRQAIGQLRQHDTISLIDSRSTLRWLAFTFGFTAAMVLYLLLSPKSSATSFQRILAPWASIKAPSRVLLEKVTPGTSHVPQGLPCPIKVELRGLGSKDKVEVRWTTDDNQNVDQRFELNAEITGSVYSANLTTDGNGIQQQLTYWVEAGDAVAGPFRLEVRPLPQITLEEARIEFPKYTGLSPQTIKGNGAVTAVEGAKVVLKATASSELKRAWVEISERESAALSKPHVVRSVPMVVEGTAVSAEWFLMLNSRQDNPTLAGYSLRGLDPDGNSKPDILLYPLTIQADLAPEVTLRTSRKPAAEGEAIKVSSRGTLPLDIEALDPDFGLTKVVLELRSGSRSIAELNLLDDNSGVRDPWKSRPSISLARYQLRPGEKIQVVAIASDNRQKPGEDSPEPNVTRSTALEFELVAPADFKEPAKTENPDGEKSEGEQVSDQDTEQSPENNAGRPNDRGSKNSGGGKKDKSQQGGNTGSSGGESSEGSEEQSGDDSQSDSGGSGSGTKSQSSSGNGNSQGEPGEPGEPDQENAEPSEGSGSGGTPGQPNSKKSSSKKPQGNSPDNQPQDDSQGSSDEQPSEDSGDAAGSAQSKQNGRGKPSNKPNSDNSESNESDSQADGSQSSSQSGAAGNNNPKRDKNKVSEPFKPEHDGDIFERLQKLSQKEKQAGSESSQADKAGQKNEQAGGSNDGSKQQKPKQSTGNADKEQSGTQGDNGLKQSDAKSSSKNPNSKSSDNANKGNPQGDTESQDNTGPDSGNKKNPSQPGSKNGSKNGSEGDKSEDKNGESVGDDSKEGLNKNNAGTQKDPGNNNADSKKNGSKSGNNADSAMDKPSDNGGDSEGDQANAKEKNQGKQGGNQDGSDKKEGSSSKDGSNSSSNSKEKQNPSEGKSGDGQDNADKNNDDPKGTDSENKDDSRGKQSDQSKDNATGQNGSKSDGSKQEDGSGSKSDQGKKSDTSNGDDSSQSKADSSGKEGSQNADSQSKAASPTGTKGSENSSGSKSSESGSQGTPNNQSAGNQSSDNKQGKPDNSGQGSKKESPNGTAAKAAKDSDQSETGSQGSDNESRGESGSKSDSAGNNGSSGTASGGSSQAGGNPGQSRSSGSQERGAGGTESNPDQANLEYSKQAASLVLDYLERQKDQPDPELLKEMNWTADDLKQFLDHWRTMEEAAKSKNPAVRHRAEQALRSLGIRPREIRSGAVQGADDQVRGLQESGLRTAPPSSLKSSFDAARKALQQKQRASEKK